MARSRGGIREAKARLASIADGAQRLNNAWNATEQYLSRSIYSGTQAQTTYTDLDQVTIAVK